MKNESVAKGMCEFMYTISGVIDQRCLEKFMEFLQNDVSDECTRLHIMICSNGGLVSVAIAIGQLLRSLPCEVVTYNISNVDSAAIAVFAGGTRRVCTPHGTFVFHPAAKEISGAKNAAELRLLAKEVDSDTKRFVSFLECCTGTPMKDWESKMNSNVRMSAKNATIIMLATEVGSPPL